MKSRIKLAMLAALAAIPGCAPTTPAFAIADDSSYSDSGEGTDVTDIRFPVEPTGSGEV